MAFDPVTAALDLGGKLIDHFFPNAADQARAKARLEKMRQDGTLATLAARSGLVRAQIAVNAVEAKHKSVFVAGARPFILWVCGAALAYTYILQPFVLVVLVSVSPGFDAARVPVLDLAELMPVLVGLLGLGGYRTLEKVKGVNHRHE